MRVMTSISAMLLLALSGLAAAAAPVPPASTAEASGLLDTLDPAAVAVIDRLAAERPDDPEVEVLRIRLLLTQGEGEQALERATAAVRRWPQHAGLHTWLGNAYGHRIASASMLAKASIGSKMNAAFERALELDPDQHEARLGLLESALRTPALFGGSVADAREHANALALRSAAHGHYARARILSYEGEKGLAAQAYLAAWRAAPGQRRVRMAAGVALQEAGQWRQALAHYQAWVAEDPGAGDAWYQIGRIAALAGIEREAGAAALRTYLELPLRPNWPAPQYAWHRLGQILAGQGDTAAARAALERALALDPKLKEAREALSKL